MNQEDACVQSVAICMLSWDACVQLVAICSPHGSRLLKIMSLENLQLHII